MAITEVNWDLVMWIEIVLSSFASGIFAVLITKGFAISDIIGAVSLYVLFVAKGVQMMYARHGYVKRSLLMWENAALAVLIIIASFSFLITLIPIVGVLLFFVVVQFVVNDVVIKLWGEQNE